MKPIKRKSFEHYINLYIKSGRELRALKVDEEIKTAFKRHEDALNRMLCFYSKETKNELLKLMDDNDIWFALLVAKDYAYNFELPFDIKTKIIEIIKRCENSKACTGVEWVSLMAFKIYVTHK